MSSNRFRLTAALTFALTFPAISYAVDQENQPSKQSEVPIVHDVPDIGGSGALDYSYDIDIPVFHGAEPELSLSYSSSRKSKMGGLYQGWLGYGWGVKGFDVIERARRRGAAPAFDGASADKDCVFRKNGTVVSLNRGQQFH